MLREFQPATRIASTHVIERHRLESGKMAACLQPLGGMQRRRRRESLALRSSGLRWLALLGGRELWNWLGFEEQRVSYWAESVLFLLKQPSLF